MSDFHNISCGYDDGQMVLFYLYQTFTSMQYACISMHIQEASTFLVMLTYLEAACEEFQPSAELSVVEQALQGSQALQTHFTLLQS